MHELYHPNLEAKVLIVPRGLNGMVKVYVLVLRSERPIIDTMYLVMFQQ